MTELSPNEMGLSPADIKMTEIDTLEDEEEKLRSIDFRAHHLFSLSQLMLVQAHKFHAVEKIFRGAKKAQFKVMGRENEQGFTDHMIDSILSLLRNQSGYVKIVNTHDVICEKCPQKDGSACQVFGKTYSADFLSSVDEAIIRNTDGVLELGKSYPPKYIQQNIGIIRKAIRRTLLEMPSLLRNN